MLTIVISKPKPLGGVDFSEYNDFINDALKEGHTPKIISYLQGKVQQVMKYDIGLCLNGENCFQGQKYIEGIYDAQIMGYGNPCKAFLQTLYGLIEYFSLLLHNVQLL